MEANYAHQQELDMIPLMMQKDYKPQGWRTSQNFACLGLLQYVVVLSLMLDHSAGSGTDSGYTSVVLDVGC